VLEITGPATALLDDGLALRVRGGGDEVTWRARIKDDDGRVWRASGASAGALAWRPAKGDAALAALRSLRPVPVDVRAERPDGRAASRTVTRLLVGPGVRVRRWREPGLAATLHLPSGAPAATVLLGDDAGAAWLAAPLLASRGVLVLVVGRDDDGAAAAARLAAVPGATEPLTVPDVPLPPGPGVAAPQPAAWDALLARLGAAPRLP